MNIQYFLDSNKQIESHFLILNKKSKFFSLVRFILFLLFISTLIWGSINKSVILYGISFLSLIIYFVIISWHRKIESKMEILGFEKEVNNEYIYRKKCNFSLLKDDGRDLFENIDEPFLEDLDLYKKESLFKYISICKTKNARNKLRDRFLNKNTDLENTQKAVLELEEKLEFSKKFQFLLKKFKKIVDKNDVNKNNHDKQKKIPIIFIVLGFILLVIFMTFLIMCIFNSKYTITCVTLLFLQVSYGFILYYINYEKFEFIDKINYTYYPLNDIYILINSENFISKILKEEQLKMESDCHLLQKFKWLTFFNSLRKNFISNIIFNAFSLNVWIAFINNLTIKKENGSDSFLNKSLDGFENFQVLISLSTFNVSKEETCIPVLLREDKLYLEFENLKHPLIEETKCVSNSFKLNNQINIITGSNMSGKTSFLRVIGMNLILMNLGCKVNGKKFSASQCKIFTSMRIKDDFINGISSFYSELLNIKKAIDYQKTGENMICFIDEIFRGTNSNDRIAGAIALIKQLSKKNVVLFLTTHDFELCDIKIDNLSNFNFEEYYKENKILFDYKIRNGKCRTTNAKYLMEMVGIE